MTNLEVIRTASEDKLVDMFRNMCACIDCGDCIFSHRCWLNHNGFEDWLKDEYKEN